MLKDFVPAGARRFAGFMVRGAARLEKLEKRQRKQEKLGKKRAAESNSHSQAALAEAPVNGSAINGSALAQSAELVLKKNRITKKPDSGNADTAGDRAKLEKIWGRNQADSAIGLKLASIYIEQNEHGKALKILEPLFQRDSSDPQVVRSLVTCYRDSGQTERGGKSSLQSSCVRLISRGRRPLRFTIS